MTALGRSKSRAEGICGEEKKGMDSFKDVSQERGGTGEI